MLRAGPFSDERVIRLINLRFVPFYFDLSDSGAAADPAARKFVVAAREELGGDTVPVPPILLMNVEGAVLGEVGNYASPDAFLSSLLGVLAAHPDYAEPSEAERIARTVLERAEICIGLQDYAGAEKLLEQETSDEAHYLLGRIARLRRDWEGMERHFREIASGALQPDVRVERAHRLWLERRYAELRSHLAAFPKTHPRYAEARYLEGLALFHLGDLEAAKALWKQTIQSCSENPWIYRADWAYSSLAAPPSRLMSTADARVSPLARVGYLGPRNPDLEGPPTE